MKDIDIAALLAIVNFPAIETIHNDIEALNAELNSNLSTSKRNYPANLIRRDIARLQADVHILAEEMLRINTALEITRESLHAIFSHLQKAGKDISRSA